MGNNCCGPSAHVTDSKGHHGMKKKKGIKKNKEKASIDIDEVIRTESKNTTGANELVDSMESIEKKELYGSKNSNKIKADDMDFGTSQEQQE